ncbi:MAG: ArsR family transcriptional regulator [Candidatus Thalassarchaeum sp.]|jgi:predicted transcriptional regulator|nr:ArsR family transcriptional regulator [Candidatus Thalassarchaeum sp.]
MSNQFTTAVIGEGGLRRVMEGVRTVRLVAALAVAALLTGGWMMSAPFDEIVEDDGDEGDKVPASLASEEDSEGDAEPELRRGEKEEGSESTLPERLIAGGAGALGSLVLGSFMLEFVKVTVLVALVSPMLARMKANREDMLTRGRLLGYLEANAGIHFSALRDALGLANGVTAYHLHTLESTGQVISWRDGKLRRYAISSLSKEEVSRIKNPIAGTRLAILEVLAESGNIGLSGTDIRSKLEISRQLLSHHLSELRNGELVEAASEARRPNWRLSDNGMEALVTSREVARIEAAA